VKSKAFLAKSVKITPSLSDVYVAVLDEGSRPIGTTGPSFFFADDDHPNGNACPKDWVVTPLVNAARQINREIRSWRMVFSLS
jgi:hypothetical protein